MSDVFGALFWLAVSLGILVTFHEFGHYWVARRCGVKVLRFSIGFGKPIWSRRDKHGTEFAIAAIPLGGYVKMLDRREADVDAGSMNQEYNGKPIWQRALIILAGPLANLLLCVALLWALFVIGKPDYAPIIGKAEGLAAISGMRTGDRIVRIDDREINTWTDAGIALTGHALDKTAVYIDLRSEEGSLRTVRMDMAQPSLQFNERNPLGSLGITFRQLLSPAVIQEVIPKHAAYGLLQAGDTIVSINDAPVDFYQDIRPLVQKFSNQSSGVPVLQIRVKRGSQFLSFDVRPSQQIEDGQPVWLLGLGYQGQAVPPDATLRLNPLNALPAAVAETWQKTKDTLSMMARLVVGKASTQNLSGIVTIARASNITAKRGMDHYINLLAMLSLSLCIINLLPIPVLDGGHLVNLGFEKLRGRPLSDGFLIKAQTVGLVLLIGLMSLTFYNDVFRPPF
jgi:regulator of sigma E protease